MKTLSLLLVLIWLNAASVSRQYCPRQQRNLKVPGIRRPR